MRILIVRIGRTGDMVMVTPAIQALIDNYSDAKFTVLTSPDGNRLLRNFHPNITDIWVWDRSSLLAMFHKVALTGKIRSSHFDRIVCFETSNSIVEIFSGSNAELFRIQNPDTSKHSARRYLDLVETVCGGAIADRPVHLPVEPEALHAVDQELKQYSIMPDDIVVAFHPSYSGYSRFGFRKRSARKHKLWPAENFALLGKKLSAHTLADGRKPGIIMDLLDDELQLGNNIIKGCDGSIALLNSRPNFARYKALLKRANLLVTPDTGPMHIGAAVNTRIIALFSGKDPGDCGPYMDTDRYIVLRSENTSNPEAGIAAISVDSVYDACVTMLNRISV